MLLQVENVLSPAELEHVRRVLVSGNFVDGRVTSGPRAASVKHNQQLGEDSPQARELGALVLKALQGSALFITAALPRIIYPPLFNRYEVGMDFGNHVDNAIRGKTNPIRTDVSVTLFLSDPSEYDGGELIIEDSFGCHAVKLAAGNLLIYPATSLHRVQPVTRGVRNASVFWVQSMVRDAAQRALLFDMDMAINGLGTCSENRNEVNNLTACYHNLLRMWADL